MKLAKRSLAILLGLLMLVTAVLPGMALVSAAEDTLIEVYASDLQSRITSATAGWKTPVFDKDLDGNSIGIANNGNAIIYEKGIVAHASSKIVYNVEGLSVAKFTAYVGIEDSQANNAAYGKYAWASFHVYADDKEVAKAGPVGIYDNAVLVEAVIPAGTKTVTLETDQETSNPNFDPSHSQGNNTSDHTVWGDAKFHFSSSDGIGITSLAFGAEKYTVEVDGVVTTSIVYDEAPATSFSYEIDDTTVAKLLPDGRIFGVQAGSATVTVTDAISGKKATAAVEVVTPAYVKDTDTWTIKNENTDYPAIYDSSKPNQVVLTTPFGDLTPASAEPQYLLTPATSDDFEITVKVTGGMYTNYHAAGLVAYVQKGTSVALERRYHSYFGGNAVSIATYQNNAYTEYKVMDTRKDTPMELKMVKKGNVFTGYYRYEGANDWTLIVDKDNGQSEIISDPVANGENLQVGLTSRFGSGVSPTPPALGVTYSDFTYGGELIPFMKAAEPEVEPDPDDIDGDGILSIQDVTVLLQALGDGDVSTLPESADVNKDGHVSIKDVTQLLLILAGKGL